MADLNTATSAVRSKSTHHIAHHYEGLASVPNGAIEMIASHVDQVAELVEVAFAEEARDVWVVVDPVRCSRRDLVHATLDLSEVLETVFCIFADAPKLLDATPSHCKLIAHLVDQMWQVTLDGFEEALAELFSQVLYSKVLSWKAGPDAGGKEPLFFMVSVLRRAVCLFVREIPDHVLTKFELQILVVSQFDNL